MEGSGRTVVVVVVVVVVGGGGSGGGGGGSGGTRVERTFHRACRFHAMTLKEL